MLVKRITELLKTREFISVATCDLHGKPNAASKFLLKIENNFIYLIDYSVGRTWDNLKVNPRSSLSFMDTDTLLGYQINGTVEIIERGPAYDSILAELWKKEIDLSAKRIIEGIYREKKHQSFELAIRDKFVIFKIKLKEIIEIGPAGELKRQNLE